MAVESLKNKTVKGIAWSGTDNVIQFSITFLISIILARLLSPNDYGLIGIVNIFISVCTVVINGGFSTALLRKKKINNDDYNTAFVVNLTLSLILYVLVFLLAPFVATFFERNELLQLTRVTALSMIIGAVSVVHQTQLTKRIDFKSQAKVTAVSGLTSGVIGVVMALCNYGVWSLVAQMLSMQLLRTLLLWLVNKWTPSFSFSQRSFLELFGFGWKIMLSGVLDRLWIQLYQVVVGKFYSPDTLGQYTRAKQFSLLISENLTNVIQRVTFPVLSDIQDERERLIDVYRRMIKITMFVTFVSMIFLAAVAEPLIFCLIGEKWMEAAGYLPLICITGMLYPLHAINLNMLQIQGRSDLFLGLEIVKKIIGIFPLVIGATIGIYPMLYVSVLINILCYFINSYFPGKILGYTSVCQLKDVSTSFFVALIAIAPVYFFKYVNISYWLVLPAQLFIGICLFLLICSKLKLYEYIELKSLLTIYLKKYYERK